MMGKLTPKQEAFVKEYLIDLNATQAAIRAGYSEKGAFVRGSELLSNRKVSEAISEAKGDRNERLDIDADYVLNRLVEIDQLDVIDILDDHGALKPLREWPKAWRQSISGIDYQELLGDMTGALKKIKWPDKVKNLEMLGRHVSVRAWDKEDIGAGEAAPMNFTFQVNPAVDEVKITNAGT